MKTINKTKHKVYMVTLNWAADGDNGQDIFLFSSKKRARNKFNNLIIDEQCPDSSWVGLHIEDGKPDEEHELTVSDNEWSFWRNGEWMDWHTTIEITEKEVL